MIYRITIYFELEYVFTCLFFHKISISISGRDLLPTPLKRKDRNNLHRKLIIFTVPVLISAWTPQKIKIFKETFLLEAFLRGSDHSR